MAKILVLVLLASLLLIGCMQSTTQASASPTDAMKKDVMAETNASATPDAMKKEASPDAMKEKEGAMNKSESETPAASPSLGGGAYEPFTKSGYDAARAEGKVVFLEFYANWCPVCKEQEPQIEEAFRQGVPANVAGFRVNYNDDQTDEDERDLARQFGVSYQHTHVLLDAAGSVKTKSLEFWDAARVRSELAPVAG